ncbi:hypothetical protein Q5752_003337 [Cryptotrichosporon argae]
MSDLDCRLGRLVDGRKDKGRYRQLRTYSSDSGLHDFSSNDYLSLSTCPALRASYLSRLASTPSILGSTGSRLLSGSTPAHAALESRLAAHFGAPAALLFNSGWDANISFFGTVPQPGDWIVYDDLVHASVHSGMRAGRAGVRCRAFRHNDAADLGAVLSEITGGRTSGGEGEGDGAGDGAGGPSAPREPIVFLALESLYSMDGDFAPLPALLDALDAHVPCARHVRLMTFGKAVGCSGAIVLCTPAVRSFLINFARPLIFSTALPHSTLVALECAWDMLDSEAGDEKRRALASLAACVGSLLDPLLSACPPGVLRLPPSPTSSPLHSPILALLTPTPHALSAFLLERGYIVRPVVPPTVPPGAERVRICLGAGMGTKVVRGLVDALAEWVELQRGRRAKL